jgi:protein phosphatase
VIPTDHSHVIANGLSHPGELRSKNEDRYVIASFESEGRSIPSVLAVVADGVGGHQAGEVAAQITIDSMVKSITDATGNQPVEELTEATLKCSQDVKHFSEGRPEYAGMGSTLAAAWLIDDRLYTVSVGDSRIYILRRGKLTQVSIDHTWVKEALDHKLITPEQAINHPNAHVIQRAIGSPVLPEPDVRLHLAPGESDSRSKSNQGLRLHSGNQVLLCSDGLTNLVKDEEIRAVLLDKKPEEVAKSLVGLARARGGPDNITVVILAVPSRSQPRRRSPHKFLKSLLAGFIGSIVLLILLTVLVAAAWWFGLWPW